MLSQALPRAGASLVRGGSCVLHSAQVLEPSFNRLSFLGEEEASGLPNLKSSSETLLLTELHELSLCTVITGKITEELIAVQNSIQPITFCLEAAVKAEN